MIQIFLTFIKVAKHSNRHPIIKKLNKLNPDIQENDRIIKDLGEGLKKDSLTTEQHNNLTCLGIAILTGELTDDTYGKDFKLVGEAIIERKLNKKTKNLLRKVLLSSKKKAGRSLKKLIKLLINSKIENNIFQNDMPFQNDGVFSEALANDSEFKKAGSKDAEDYELIDTILKSNKPFKKYHNQDFIMLLQKSFKTDVSTDDKYKKILRLLELALVRDKKKGVQYKKILELFVDSLKKKKPIEIDNQEILDYINTVLNPKVPLDIAKLAKQYLKGKNLAFNRYEKSASKTVVNKKSPHALNTNSVPKNFTAHDRNKNKVSSIAENGSSGGPNSTTVGQNGEKASIKTTISAKLKKRRKRSSKSLVKFNSESNKSEDKFKKSRKKSLKKTKSSKRKTEDAKKHKSKEKHNKSTQKV
jgi:hypothetical protein